MIETKDLIEYTEGAITNCDEHQEYIKEIVVRLKAFDKLKEGIKNKEAKMKIEKIKEKLRFVKEERNLPGEDLARMIEILKDKVNEIINVLNSLKKEA